MVTLINNGYIIQKKSLSNYRGIEGDNWYMNYCSNNSYFEEFYDKNIDKAWNDSNHVDCCTDTEYMKNYIAESLKIGIEFNILLCATCKSEPILKKLDLGRKGKILGYDYAYSGGSYYSCILNDILSKRIDEFKEIQLNKNGLFNTYEEAEEFSIFRKKLKSSNSNYVLEDGEFVIYRLTEINI